MTVLYLTEYNTKCYGVTLQNIGCVKAQKFEVISNDENNLLYTKPIESFIGKSQVCDMTLFSGALDKSVFDGNTILPKISQECGRRRYICIGGDMVCSSLTNDDIHEYKSNVESNLTPDSIAIGEENIYFLTPQFKFIRRDTIEYDKLLTTNEWSVDPYDYHISTCGKDSFKKLRMYKIHSNYD